MIGPIRSMTDHSWPHGVTRVWRVVGSETVWVKQHTEGRKFRQESRAYGAVVPALGAAGFRVATRIADWPSLRTLALTDVRGDRAPDGDPAVHRQAGAASAVLHALPLDDTDPVPIADALRARLTRWVSEASGAVDPAWIERIRAEIGDGTAFDGCDRRWCHRDWSPRNWLIDEEGRLGLLDFEHCGPDLWLFDLVKLADDAWRRFPDTRAAYFDGYGRPLDAVDQDRLRRLMWLHALGTTAWAATHGDPAYEAHGRALLAALHAGWAP
ncbi:MAG: aminoglycoside phosphotransferase family protein [Myxococcota bacterium]